MKAEHELLNEAFADEPFKQKTLQQTLGYLRSRTQRRRVVAMTVAGLVLILAFVWALPHRHEKVELRASAPVLPKPTVRIPAQSECAPMVPGTSIRVLRDEELLKMLPDRAVAIVGTGDQRQLVFLDDQRQSGKHGS
jgi:hypothetical protein